MSKLNCSGPCAGPDRTALPGKWWCLGCWRAVPANLRVWFLGSRRRSDGSGCLKAKAVIDEHLALLKEVETQP